MAGKTAKKKYDKAMDEQVYKICLLGATDVQIADILGIAKSTLNVWKKTYPELMAAMTRGKQEADALVAHSLFKRATGYSHPDTHISNFQGEITKTEITKHYPPDTTACIFWLKNRDKENWRDKQDHEHTGKNGTPLIPVLNVTVGGTKPKPPQ